MAVLLPEKTVEIWTAIAVAGVFPTAELWSPTNYAGSVDQWVRAGKTWAFELKTADEGPPIGISIDIAQLQQHAFDPPHRVPVLYVLPMVDWSVRPLEPLPVETSRRATFPNWAWVISAAQLARHLVIDASPRRTGRPRLHLAEITRRFMRQENDGWQIGMTLREFLARVRACTEPGLWTVRRETQPLIPNSHDLIGEILPVDEHYLLVRVPLSELEGPLFA